MDDYCTRLIVFLAFFGANDAFGGFFDLWSTTRGADAADMLISDPALGIDEEALGDTPDAIVDGDLPRFVSAVGIGDVEFLRKAGRIFLGVLQRHAEKTIFLSLIFCQAASISLASSRQGGHQEAQKFRNTALPRRSSRG